jgi:hypothetical protein
MKHILRPFSIALALFYATGTATAFVPAAPPHSGPGSVFHGNEEATPLYSGPKQPKQKVKKQRSGAKQTQQK